MQNTVFVERKLRRNLTYVLTVLIVFFGLMIAMLVTASMIDKQILTAECWKLPEQWKSRKGRKHSHSHLKRRQQHEGI